MSNRGKENRAERTASRAANRTEADKGANPDKTAAKKKTKGKPSTIQTAKLLPDPSSGAEVPAKGKSASTKRKKAAAPAKENDEPDDQPMTPERTQRLLEELRITKAKLAAEQTARKAAEDEAAKVSKKRTRKAKLIPQPKGTCGRHYHLRPAMRLGEREDADPEKNLARKHRYSNILHTVRDVALLGGLKWRKGIRYQNTVALGAVYEVACNEEPYLEHFENDWATGQIISQFFMNRRRHEVKKGGGGKNGNNSPKTIRKRILGKVAPATENRGDRSSPADEQEDVEAGLGDVDGVDNGAGQGGEGLDEDFDGPGIGGNESDPNSGSEDSEKEYGEGDEEDDEDEEEESDDEDNEGGRSSARKRRRLT
ncbi:hypothetical protein LXA43DRAFT_1100663 [Ganoderma leucocontextum]|nr:hypothetical protein LXA43DRAFT_1100663 [Ganoderma leucocontextum]